MSRMWLAIWILLLCAALADPVGPNRWGAATHLPLLEAGAEAIGDLLAVGSFSTAPPLVRALGLNATSGSLALVAGPTPHVLLRCDHPFPPNAVTAITAADTSKDGVDELLVQTPTGLTLVRLGQIHARAPDKENPANCPTLLSSPLTEVRV